MQKFILSRDIESIQRQEFDSLNTCTPKQRYENNVKAIRIIKEIELNPRKLDEHEILSLATFAGWGALADVFRIDAEDKYDSGWKLDAQRELKRLLSEQEYRLASESILNAHYTSPEIAHVIWDSLCELGFFESHFRQDNIREILEPSCGNGLFFATIPEQIRNSQEIKLDLFGVELDKYPVKIAQTLHQDATIYNTGFESAPFDDESFDLIISNVPFGSYSIHDTRYNHLDLGIHNYFLAKSSDLVRSGGYVVIITSTSFLDSKSQKFREWLSKKLRLVTAIRLPNNTFDDVSNTEVCTDILIFRKVTGSNKFDIKSNENYWLESKEIIINPNEWQDTNENGIWSTEINEFFEWELSQRKRDRNKLEIARNNHGTATGEYWKNRIYSIPHRLLGVPVVNKLYGRGFALANDGRNVPHDVRRVAKEIAAIQSNERNQLQTLISNAIKTNGEERVQQELSKLNTPILTGIKVLSKIKTSELIQLPQELIETKEGNFVIWSDLIYKRVGTKLEKTNIDTEMFLSFVNLKSSLDELIRAQQQPDETILETCQQQTRELYNKFTGKYGYLNSKRNVNLLGCDSRYYLLRTLEKDNNSLADILTKRISRVYSVPGRVHDITDALVHSLNDKGKLDIEFICNMMSLDKPKVIELLLGESLVYFDPDENDYVRTEQYLSGNVYKKLQSAKKHELESNIKALEMVQPLPMLPLTSNEEIKISCLRALNVDFDSIPDEEKTKLLSKSISVNLGTNWIPISVYKAFAREILNISPDIRYLEAPIANFTCESSYFDEHDRTEFGTNDLDSSQILEKALNNQDPKVTKYFGDGEVNTAATNEATEFARGKLILMKEAFKNWIWDDETRSVELCKYYNQNINVYAERKYDGSYLKLPGSNPGIKLRQWQLNGVARILEQNSTFLAHEVGLGKTLTMVTAVMEARRLGLAKRPMLVVLNGTEKQIADEFRRMYPMANLLVPEKLDANTRKLFTANIVTGDFDCVIVTQPQFFTLAMSSDYQISFLEKERQELEKIQRQNKNNYGLTKKINRAIKNVESRINRVLKSKRKDSHIDFEQLNIDMLLLDEINFAKKLSIQTRINNVRGIPTGASQRSLDTYMKLLYTVGDIVSRGFAGKIIGSTGTIVSNTMAEVFNWSRMFQQRLLVEKKLHSFDAWISQFGEPISSSEISPAGEYRVITRLKSFQNIQVLRSMMSQFVDIATVQLVGNEILQRPTARYFDISVEPSEDQIEFLRIALKRAELIRSRQVDPTEDNMLKITSDLTKAALSMRLLGKQNETHISKLHEASFNIFKIWESTSYLNGTQLVFCDFSTPKKDQYNVYEYIKLVLLRLGVPENQIAFIHDYDKKKRAKLFDDVNSGKIRIVFGSTEKLGTGCNVHRNGLFALHHIDAPWRPSDIEQREGRGIRQGNGENLEKIFGTKLNEILVFRYITERLDALRWQTLQWKQEMINKFINGVGLNQIEDCDQVVYSFAQVKSIASGNPLLLEESNLRNELNSLLIQNREHEQQQLSLGYKIRSANNMIHQLKPAIKSTQADIETSSSNIWGELSKQQRDDIQKQVVSKLKELQEQNQDVKSIKLLEYRGFTLKTGYIKNKGFAMSLYGNDIYTMPFKRNHFNIGFKASDILGSIDKFISFLPDYLEFDQLRLVASEKELERYLSLRGREFPKLQRLLEIQDRLLVIDKELSDANEAIGAGDESQKPEKDSDNDDEEISIWTGDDMFIDSSNLQVDDNLIESLRSRDVTECEWYETLRNQLNRFVLAK